MTAAERRTLEAALALQAQYGDDAEVIAMLRAAEYAAAGDVEGLAEWDDILACLARLTNGEVPRSAMN